VRTYTLKEVAKIINVSTSAIKRWEKDLTDLLLIPRSKQGARIYSELEVNQLIEIKHWQEDNLSKTEIREKLMQQQQPSESVNDDTGPAIQAPANKEDLSNIPTEISKWNQEQFFVAMDQYKNTFLNEVKDEIRKTVRTEIVEEVKKEISKGNLLTVKALSDSLYKANANMQDELKELSFTVQKATDFTDKTFTKLEKTISDQSLEAAEEFYSISKQLAETSAELSHYIDVTNNEICSLSEAFEKDREYLMEDREKFHHEVRQREMAFQSMLASFRDAAATKEKKWWKFW
jgi:DNA-binding transcriptional MerR regulator